MSDDGGALRQFALSLYGKPGVSDSCLLLQERCKVDVNVLFLAAWLGAVKGICLDLDHVAAARTLVDPWHQEIVRLLRTVRRRLKSGPPPAPSEATDRLRRDVQRIEIEAELIELDTLQEFGDARSLATVGQGSEEMAVGGMIAVAEQAAGRALSDEETAALRSIAFAAAITIDEQKGSQTA